MFLLAATNAACGSEPDYYNRLLAAVKKDVPGVQQDTGRALTDTSNNGNKMERRVIFLDSLTAGGRIADVYLGMPMDHVVRVWGHPQEAWWN